MSTAVSADGTAGGARPARPSPSIGDVARLAGVSAQTVSRVSTGADNVRPATRDRVLAAMDELGYSPNHAARALRSGSFGTIGMIAHRLARTGESRTVEAVVEAARAEGYTVSLVDVQSPSSDEVTEAAARLSHQSIDGLVIIRAETATPTNLVLPPRVPVVVSDSRFAGHHPAVGADQVTGTHLAVQHLLDLGHHTVHHLAGPASSAPAEIRVETWRAHLIGAGRPVPEPLRGDWSARSGYQHGQRIAEAVRRDAITAVFAANDEMAAGLIRALSEAGLRVPRDVSVVGFDDIPLAEFLWPPLTTVQQDFHLIGRQLMDLLLRQIRDREVVADQRIIVPTRLVQRASTAPPRSGTPA
ncbi:LacI family DNA-binding transcriptional regulator [Cellulomonas denverensis]|uniref:LacI family transcriptional regulator n=1 Tax=Cellulomonas denverensis TaxID=264297 RepID=A0A7X6KUQ9_9CELL|nr:LacI family DNA-binding transcriptional regulator [Cellulomonas denverensis]NKY22651.1 LacI family transcriptional regulator [Cellulomonas denverensis]GIG24701.1 LacI family transcriptional regulator [Cellulomonas denverensis]